MENLPKDIQILNEENQKILDILINTKYCINGLVDKETLKEPDELDQEFGGIQLDMGEDENELEYMMPLCTFNKYGDAGLRETKQLKVLLDFFKIEVTETGLLGTVDKVKKCLKEWDSTITDEQTSLGLKHRSSVVVTPWYNGSFLKDAKPLDVTKKRY